ncbi:Glycerol-3-phosphate acyltransferase [Gimesia panareensis]|uniref:Glycerol-3-phosphate acyltransferase n=1 Tax=Gimesia panareensis TaxID=2527978 RepID=A0A518FPX9_9PLAN|nr:glycerol-3-phosphate 1-O-acyltransferase PlsY [Gimesia panareensis]QDV18335.1 Glycerol-3-phosphate acyltransferase [Gimesia panareensis]
MFADYFWFFVAVACYLAGSIPFGLVTAKLVAGTDIRKVGSGNIGATNVARTLGAKWGIVVLVLDALKGLLPVLFIPALFVNPDSPDFDHARVLSGVATILGHMFPLWLGFRGGKGVATSLGVILVLGPWSTLAAVIAFALTFFLSRIVALSSIVAALAFGVAQFVQLGEEAFTREKWSLTAFSIAVPLLIIARHRSNLGRIMRGEEKKFQFGSRNKAEADSSAASQQQDG